MFLQGKICVSAWVASRLRNIFCLNSAFLWSILVAKIISPVISDTVKCSFLDEKIVYQSFYHASFTFSYFLLQGKVLCFARVNKSLARCLFVESVQSTVSKKIISGCFWLKLFIKNGKMLFLSPNNSLSKFLWCAAHVKLCFTSRIISVFWHASASRMCSRCLSN